MKKNKISLKYDKLAKALYISVAKGKVAKTEENRKGFLIDYDKDGYILGIEILDIESETADKGRLLLQIPVKK